MEDKGDGDISEDTGTLYTVGGVDLRDTGVEKIIEQICRMVVGELNAQGISDRKEVFLEEQKGAVFERLVLMERKKGQKDD